jgi:hypothetical protein
MSHQAKLVRDVGTWDGEIEVHPGPGAAPQHSTGVMTNRLIGGRWIVSSFKNETTGFEGEGIYGWDEAKQAYVGTWVDSMRGSLVIGAGSFDEATGTTTYRFELASGERTIRWRDVHQVIDDDTRRFSSFIEYTPGQEHEVVRATYRRRA